MLNSWVPSYPSNFTSGNDRNDRGDGQVISIVSDM